MPETMGGDDWREGYVPTLGAAEPPPPCPPELARLLARRLSPLVAAHGVVRYERYQARRARQWAVRPEPVFSHAMA